MNAERCLNHTLILKVVSRKDAKVRRLITLPALAVSVGLGRVTEDQPIKVGVISQRVQIVVVLCTNTKVWL